MYLDNKNYNSKIRCKQGIKKFLSKKEDCHYQEREGLPHRVRQ